MAQDTFTHSTNVETTIGDVWQSLQDPETWAAIPGVDRVYDATHGDDNELTGFKFESVVAGKQYTGTARPGPRAELRLMTWDISTPDLKGGIEVEILPFDELTRVTVTMTAQSVGMLSSVFFPVIAGAIRTGFPEAVKDFAARLSPPS